ncbi:hypothetical protein HETIRDRAFT_449455 [Heterobasidion irregulare TC 32-1]|uniref:SHSP domain-containing protein n=1 Tax=Heterobasidion irregulare (strain TC 32-1) TaxID=747525 RepID=W4KFL6_HETIT|nr:uncharacterized protein HETIRDRAFT_449455 [Heterobasidion irregulare TC 32-1]ETW83826.1 hypothetical protein HETIRDRAFT_449455 [Heterobasidion irregulare TC 32-1]
MPSLTSSLPWTTSSESPSSTWQPLLSPSSQSTPPSPRPSLASPPLHIPEPALQPEGAVEPPKTASRRTPPPSAVPQPRFRFNGNTHSVDIPLPCPGGRPFAPEMITISLKRGDRMDIVADAWHLEEDCHYEWHISLPRAIDISSLRARFNDDGTLLTIDVRNTRYSNRAGN